MAKRCVQHAGTIYVSVGYIPVQWDIRPVTSHGKGQYLSEAEKMPRAKPDTLPRCNESTDPSQVKAQRITTSDQCVNRTSIAVLLSLRDLIALSMSHLNYSRSDTQEVILLCTSHNSISH